jgi:hypothetical protein
MLGSSTGKKTPGHVVADVFPAAPLVALRGAREGWGLRRYLKVRHYMETSQGETLRQRDTEMFAADNTQLYAAHTLPRTKQHRATHPHR